MSDEQRREPGCFARRMQRDFHPGLLGMAACPTCLGETQRARRTVVQRLYFDRLYACGACGTQVRRPYSLFQGLWPKVAWPLGLYTMCAKCGTGAVRQPSAHDLKARRRSLLDALKRTWGRMLYRCPRCNVTYFDLRPSRWRRDGRSTRHHASAPEFEPVLGTSSRRG